MAMKKNRRGAEIFSMSFLDIICCGFGAMVLLVLLSKTDVLSGMLSVDQARAMLNSVSAAEDARDAAEAENARLLAESERLAQQIEKLQNAPKIKLPEQQLAERRARLASLREEVDAMSQVKEKAQTVGGIAVDSDHVIFIIDTSGTMERIKDQLARVLENVLNLHPKVENFHVMNASGKYLDGRRASQWRPDTGASRLIVLNSMKKWRLGWAGSASSPMPGLRKALNDHGKVKSLSIYVFGDHHSGAGDADEITRLNRDNKTGEPRARINGIGFFSGTPDLENRFTNLMKEIAHRNRGAFFGGSASSGVR